MNIKTNLANKDNYGGARSTSAIKYIVVHYTGNDGDTDENNAKYFQNNIVQASAHYFVDDDSITQTVPDDYVAWHCGAKTYKHATCRNANSIGVEICDDVKNGVIYPSDKTIENALELVEYLMKKYSVPKENVIRHYDVTGKLCPAYWCGTKEKDDKWKSAFWGLLGASKNSPTTDTGENKNTASVDTVGVLYRVQVGAYSVKANAEAMLAKLKNAGFDAFITTNGGTAVVADPEPVNKTVEEIAKEVIQGKWGNGTDRKNRLTAAGYDYEEVRKMVNKLLG